MPQITVVTDKKIIVVPDQGNNNSALTLVDIQQGFKDIVAESDIDITKKEMRQALEDAFKAFADLFDPEDK